MTKWRYFGTCACVWGKPYNWLRIGAYKSDHFDLREHQRLAYMAFWQAWNGGAR